MIDINTELSILAAEQKEEAADIAYQEMLDVMMEEHYMMVYASYSYDQDAIEYGNN